MNSLYQDGGTRAFSKQQVNAAALAGPLKFKPTEGRHRTRLKPIGIFERGQVCVLFNTQCVLETS